MKTPALTSVSLLLATATVTATSTTAVAAQQAGKEPGSNIVQTAIAAGQFKTLATALGAAGLVETLSGKGPFTVFAPTDKAFAKLPKRTIAELLKPKNKAKLTAILTYHVVSGKIDAATALTAGSAKTLQGDKIKVSLSGGQLQINKSKVIANDVQASNGIIHIIDTVLLPPAPPQPKELSRSQVLRKVIEDAIEAGVPLFNDGQPAACAALYRLAAFSVLNLGRDQLSKATRRKLAEALSKAKSGSDTDRAWTLRGALDQTLRELMHTPKPRPQRRTSLVNGERMNTKTLFTFDDPRQAGWRSVNDDVMGGISKGRMIFNPRTKIASFEGALSLENNGGFSTVRSKSRDLGLRGFDGLVLRVKGDGRTYKLQALGGDSRWEMRNYQRAFQTTKGEWQEIRVPFKEMELSVRGRRFAGKTIDGSKVRSLGLSIADKNESPFELQIDWIKGYRGSAVKTSANSD